jgi:hypothetical protein
MLASNAGRIIEGAPQTAYGIQRTVSIDNDLAQGVISVAQGEGK